MSVSEDPFSPLARIATALERIADLLEREAPVPVEASVPISITLDGKEIHRRVVHYTLQRAARGPSSLVGGSFVPKGENK